MLGKMQRTDMNSIRKFILINLVAFVVGGLTNAQTVTGGSDTIMVKQKKEQTREQSKEQDKGDKDVINNSSEGKSSKSSAAKNKSAEVKQVKGARPDMSKAKGARPQSIERPAGSRIPKGVGKPAGAGKSGGR